MGRSSRSQADYNRRRIVEVASGLFRANGIEAVGIADVMKAVGMTQGGFYRHFASKEGLATEACTLAFQEAAEKWRRVAQDAAQNGRDVTEALTAHYLAPKSPDMTCPMIALAPDAARRPSDDPLRQAYVAGVRGLFNTFAELAAANDSESTDDRLRVLFAGMVGSNMLARAADAEASAFGQAAIAASAKTARHSVAMDGRNGVNC
jgi:TetR/AcrR family transcriptional repressor of nem operon